MDERKLFVQLAFRLIIRKCDTVRGKRLCDLRLHLIAQMNGDIRFVDENKGRNAVKFEQLPKRSRMILYAVRCADNEDRIVQKRKRSFRFRGKVYVTGCVQ